MGVPHDAVIGRHCTMAPKGTSFDRFHPAVCAVYFAAMLVFSMAAMQPVYVAISLIAAFSCSVCVRGVRASLRTALWQMPLILVLALANPLFVASGSTELFRVGLRAFYLESLVYGACMGMMLAGVMLWFSNAAHALSSDKIMALLGNAAPVIGLMLSMTARLVPSFVREGKNIGDVQKACTAADSSALHDTARSRMRLVSVLMSSSMEDSLETADAMRARGWSAGMRRTTYARWRFRRRDGIALALVIALIAANAVLVAIACAPFHFYPTLTPMPVWWGYAPFALLAFVPVALEIKENLRWKNL